MADPTVAIPPEYEPRPDQIPSWVVGDEQLARFRLCFAIGRAIAKRDDVVFVRQLYHGDIPTDELPTSGELASPPKS